MLSVGSFECEITRLLLKYHSSTQQCVTWLHYSSQAARDMNGETAARRFWTRSEQKNGSGQIASKEDHLQSLSLLWSFYHLLSFVRWDSRLYFCAY
jgi:hypothetical protein